jgi:hypothetical protein
MKKNKQQLNEFGLIDVLRPLAVYWFAKLLGNLLTDFQSYMDGRDYKITKAIQSIIKNLQSNPRVVAKMNDIIEKSGFNGLVYKVLQFPETQSELNKYKNDKNIKFDVLQDELKNVFEKGFDTTAQKYAAQQLEKDLK